MILKDFHPTLYSITKKRPELMRKTKSNPVLYCLFLVVAQLICSNSVAAQPDVTTSSIRIQHVKGCANLFYPSEAGHVISDTDRHQMAAPPSSGGSFGGLSGALETRVTRAMGASRDGNVHTDDELAAAGYSEETEGDKKYRVKDFSVRRRVKFKLCIKPGFDGDNMTMEARHFDFDLQQDTTPDNVLQFGAAATTTRVRAANQEFERRAKAAIDALIARLNRRVTRLEDLDIVKMFRRRGLEKQVPLSFSGQNTNVTVKLRRVD